MDSVTTVAQVSIITAGLTIALASLGPSLGEAFVAARAVAAIAQQPDEAATITRTLFVSMAIVESIAIYCFVISLVLIFANPFWNYVISQ
jgi:F-type H+-transporting ATPase subunit c